MLENLDSASKEELIECVRSLQKKVNSLNQEKSTLRTKLSHYRASVAEAYLLEGFAENNNNNNDNDNDNDNDNNDNDNNDNDNNDNDNNDNNDNTANEDEKSSKNKSSNKQKKQIKYKNNVNNNNNEDNDNNNNNNNNDIVEDNYKMKIKTNIHNDGDEETNQLIAELQNTIMDLQQQLAEARRYNMQLDRAHKNTIRESRQLRNELSKRNPNGTNTNNTELTYGTGNNEQDYNYDQNKDEDDDDNDDDDDMDKDIVEINVVEFTAVKHHIANDSNIGPFSEINTEINHNFLHQDRIPDSEKRRNEPSIMSSEAEELDVNSKENRYRRRPSVRKLGINADGFEEYDIDFGDGFMNDESYEHENNNNNNNNTNDSVNVDNNNNINKSEDKPENEKAVHDTNRELRHQLLEEQLRVEELKHERRKSVLAARAYQDELSKLKTMTPEEIKEYMSQSNQQPAIIPDLEELEAPIGVVNVENSNMESNLNNNNNDKNNTSTIKTSQCGKDCECYELNAIIQTLKEKLDQEHKNVERLTRGTRISLARMSERAFRQMLEQENEHHQEKDQLNDAIQKLQTLNERLITEKCNLLQSTCQTIDHLREHIKTLSNRLNRTEQ